MLFRWKCHVPVTRAGPAKLGLLRDLAELRVVAAVRGQDVPGRAGRHRGARARGVAPKMGEGLVDADRNSMHNEC